MAISFSARTRAFGALAASAVLLTGCQRPATPVRAQARQDWFQLRFGVIDKEPADWSGSIEATGGRVVSLAPWRFDRDDRFEPGGRAWKCATRLAETPIPQDWFVGAIHIPPKDLTRARGPLMPNGVFAGIEGASSVRVQTVQGAVEFRPAEIRFGAPLKLLNGRVEVERVPAALNHTAGNEREDDYPSVAVDSGGTAWVAWVSYRDEREQLVVSRADGGARQVIAEGEYFRPSLSAGSDGALHLAVSVNTGGSWKIGHAARTGGAWSQIQILSSVGPDLAPRTAVDSQGRVWIAWQGYRGGRSRVVAMTRDGSGWGPETVISANTDNAWAPSVAADARGRVHFAWDAYDGGDYNIYYRVHDGRRLLAQRRITASPEFQAHASVAADRSGRAWIAFDEGGANWGKDTGFLADKNNGATMLYASRRARMAVVGDAGVWTVDMPEGFLEQPQLAAGPDDALWCLMRRRQTKLHAVYSPSLRRDRLQQYSMWDYAAASLTGSGWSPLVTLPSSLGRNDQRAAIAAAAGGRAALVWAGDGRSYAKPYPFIKSDVHTGEVSGAQPGEPKLAAFTEPPSSVKPVHPREAGQVTRMRNARITAGGKGLRVLRGDMHRHTDLSFDGDLDGSLWDFYRYTIDAAGFDYSAVTEHNAGDDIEYFWWIIQKSNDLYHYPGRFTPMYAYERSLRFPNGHRNLIWTRRGVRTLPRSDAEEKGAEGAARLYEYLRKTGGIAMSHTSATLMGTDWRDNDKDLEPLVEIYQGDRTSYEYEGAPRAARGNDKLTQPGGYQPEGFVWNAWAKGYKLGVQASSDHASTHISYAVLLAEDSTREAILNAIRARHAYGATDNILVDFRSGDHIQGDIFTATARPRLTVRVEGTAAADKVEIIRNNQIIHTTRPGRASVQFTFEDADARSGESYYYVRVQQVDGQMAWSSPMWISAATPPR